MKKFFVNTMAALLLAQSAHALILNDKSTSCHRYGNGGDCAVEITVSLPTLLIEGQEMDLNSQEANARLELEANGLAEKQLISLIAKGANTTAKVVVAEILQLQNAGQEVSVEAVLSSLKNR